MMMIIFFLNGLSFGGLGLAAYLQMRQGIEFPLKKHLPWLAAFGFACGANSWVEMFLSSGGEQNLEGVLVTLRLLLQPLTGLLLLKFGWGIFKEMAPLPAWMSFIPGVLIVPLAYIITYAATTFVTPSPIEIPIDIWSRYLLYLPGSVIAGAGFLRQWYLLRKDGLNDVATLMLGAGMAFLIEAFVVGLVVPAAPYGPASYYNYDRVGYNAFIGERSPLKAFGLTAWLDYDRVLQLTGLPIEFWRMLSTFAVTFFVVRGLGVFEAVRRRQQAELERERDRAQERAFRIQKTARENAEKWTDALVAINRRISMLANVDTILLDILRTARSLLRSDYVGLGLYNEDRSHLVLKCHSHTGGAEIVSTPVFIQNRLILQTVRANRSYRSQKDVPEEALENVCPLLKLSARAVAIVPIELENQSIGALWVARCKQKKNGSFSGTDLIWLECLADQVVIAIQHGLMTSKLQSLSVVEERARIAREMHDGLAQVLGYMNLQVQTLQALFRQGKQEELQTELQHMRQAIKSAHADVRENILSLRTTLANEKGLVSALGEYLDEFSIQAGLEATFSPELTEAMELASIAEVQLVCIMQEALANVRKHSNATRVDVCLKKVKGDTVDQVCMEIVDNGIGFSKGKSQRTFGLQTMRERASTVGGTLEVHSSPGEGTSIICRLPCLKPDEMRERSVFLS